MISSDDKLTYACMYVLKKLDLSPDDGGMSFPVVLPHSLVPLEPALEQLVLDGHVEIHRRKGRYQLTDRGIEYVGILIDEAEALIEELDDLETEEVAAVIRKRNLNAMRVRFLWGWYQGEFDDLVLFQQRRGAALERDWGMYLLSDEFYAELARDLA
ncbi:MAG: hypothetical protein AAF799_44005 [Myxococcota bacterium]